MDLTSTFQDLPDNGTLQINVYSQNALIPISGDRRRLFVTLGQFSIIRLERDAQLIVPVLDYSIPTKECCDNVGCAEDPCEMFSRIPFPTQQFTPRGCDAEQKDNCGYQTTGNC